MAITKHRKPPHKASLLHGWRQPSYKDVATRDLHIEISEAAFDLLKDSAIALGISKAQMCELVITSAVPGSHAWDFASRRYQLCKEERSYLQKLRRRMVGREQAEAASDSPKDSELKNIFRAIVDEGVKGDALLKLMEQEGITFRKR